MKYVFSVSVLMLALSGLQASADWTCSYSCGSKSWQEVKMGHGWSQQQAMQEAQSQICTEYVGGNPQYFQGCEYNDPYSNGSGSGSNNGGGGYQEWECTYACGSKGQEPKVGHGLTEDEATREAKSQICTRYVGGNPTYFEGCSIVSH